MVKGTGSEIRLPGLEAQLCDPEQVHLPSPSSAFPP